MFAVRYRCGLPGLPRSVIPATSLRRTAVRRTRQRWTRLSFYREPEIVKSSQFFGSTGELGCDLASTDIPEGLEVATFAGAFPLAFQRMYGVVSTTVGYTQGRVAYPCYAIILSDTTGHALAIQVLYDPDVVTYGDLIDELFRHIDPTTLNQQRSDKGKLYRSGIYYHTRSQKRIAEAKLKELQELIHEGSFREAEGDEVVVELKSSGDFYVAEQIHQNYLENGGRAGFRQSAEKGCQDPIIWFQ